MMDQVSINLKSGVANNCRSQHIPSQAFTVVAVFNSMTFALKVTPSAVRSLSEGAVAVQRFQVRDINKSVNHPMQSWVVWMSRTQYLIIYHITLHEGQQGKVGMRLSIRRCTSWSHRILIFSTYCTCGKSRMSVRDGFTEPARVK